MEGTSKTGPATIIPTLRYRDAASAIDWLCKAFGFQPHLVVPGEGEERLPTPNWCAATA